MLACDETSSPYADDPSRSNPFSCLARCQAGKSTDTFCGRQQVKPLSSNLDMNI